MRTSRKCALIGALGMALVLTATPAVAGDPFEDARYYVTIDDAKVLALVDSGKVSVSDTNPEGYTLLHYAADANRLALVQALLQRGADPRAKSQRGSTPFDMATNASVKVALAKTAPGRGPVPSSGGASITPGGANVPSAAGNDGSGICASVRAEGVNDGRSAAIRPLMKARDAIWYNQPDLLTALLDDCVNANAKDPSGSTLLHAAASRNRVDAARILLAHGASKALTDAQGNVPAAYAESDEMRAILGGTPRGSGTSANAALRTACQQKYRADVALAYDDTMKMRAMNKWSRCLKTGLYQ